MTHVELEIIAKEKSEVGNELALENLSSLVNRNTTADIVNPKQHSL